MLDNSLIAMRQFKILVILVTIGDAIMILPSIPADEAMQDAWIATLLAILFGLLIVYLFTAVGNTFPKVSFVDYITQTFGKWIGSVVIIFFLCYLLLSISAHIRQIGNFTILHMLQETPIEAVHFIILSLIVYAARLGIETIARTSEIFFFWFVFFLFLLLLAVAPNINGDQILPMLPNGFKPVIRGSLASTTFMFAELVVFLVIFPFVIDQQKIRRDFMIAALIGGLVITVLTIFCILVLGPGITSRNIYPVYTLARKINVGDFFQRVEVIFTVIWMMTAYMKITLYFYAFNVSLAQLLKLKNYRILTLPTAFIAFTIAMMVAGNTIYFYEMIRFYWPFYDLTVGVLIPIMLLLVYKWRQKLKKGIA